MERRETEHYPEIFSLPHSVLRRLAGLLDGSAVHNWKALVAAVAEYTQNDARQFSIEEQQGRSPTMAILADLNSHGWSVVDLAYLAHRAHLGIVVDTIREHCRKKGLSLPLPPPCSLHSAKTCYDRPSTPPKPTPPTTPTAQVEAILRYGFTPTPALLTMSGQADQGLVSRPHPLVTPTGEFPMNVPYRTLLEVTGGFSQVRYEEGGHKLGEGGSGEVFHCIISSGEEQQGREVAVKVLGSRADAKDKASLADGDRKQFLTEIQALSLLSHTHLLRVLGYSYDGPHLCLLYPFLPRGSLDRHLKDEHSLTTPRRLQVASDVASALEYLHTGTEHVVVHRDVKSANILLTEEWRGVLGDYGVLRFQPSSGTAVTTTVAGTLIYMAPEYKRGGTVTDKTDVFSFGVVLYELAMGVCAHSSVKRYEGDTEGTDLLSFVEEYEGEVQDIFIGWWDGVWQEVWSLAEQCVHDSRHKRPSSTEVHKVLLDLCQRYQPQQ